MHTAKRRGKTDGAGERGMCIKPWCYGCRQNKMLVVCLLLLLTDCKKVKYCYNSSVTGCSVSCLLEWFIICAESKMLVVFVCVLLTLTKKNGYIIMQAAMCCVTGNHWGFLVFFVRFVLEGASLECIRLFCMVSNLTLFCFSGRSVHESNWSENQNARWTKTMAGGWLGPYHTTKDGNPSQLFRNDSAGVIISVYSKHLI